MSCPSRNPVCVWDFTLFSGMDSGGVISILEKFTKKWSFQKEKTENGKVHYQGRFSLKLKSRDPRLMFPSFHLGVTSGENRDNMFYVTKEESRVEGPWADTDEKIYIPKDIRIIKVLMPWQQSVIDILQTYDPRKVHVVWDPNGNSGKTTLARWCMCYKIARKLPFVNNYKDIMRMVMDMPTATGYMMDMPRAVKKDQLFQLYAGIEEVKGGYAYDDRYHFKEKLFDPPAMVLFTNQKPDIDLLSRDRWNIWNIKDKVLVPFVEDAVPNDAEDAFLGRAQ